MLLTRRNEHIPLISVLEKSILCPGKIYPMSSFSGQLPISSPGGSSSPRSSSIATTNVELRKGDARRIQERAREQVWNLPKMLPLVQNICSRTIHSLTMA